MDAVVRQLASLHGKDVLISPDIEGLSTTSFDRVDLGITRGQQAAQAVQISAAGGAYARWEPLAQHRRAREQ